MEKREHTPMYSPEQLAERAYAAYCSNQGNVDRNNQLHLPWQHLPETERAAWMAAVHVVTTNANEIAGRDPASERERELRGESTEHKKENGKSHAHAAR